MITGQPRATTWTDTSDPPATPLAKQGWTGAADPRAGLREHGERAGSQWKASPDPCFTPWDTPRTAGACHPPGAGTRAGIERCWVTVSWTQLCWQPPLPTVPGTMAGDPVGQVTPGRPARPRALPRAGSGAPPTGSFWHLRAPPPSYLVPEAGRRRQHSSPSRSKAWLCFSAHKRDTQGHDPNLGPLAQLAPGLSVGRHCRAAQWKPSPPPNPGHRHKTPGPAEGQGIRGSRVSRLGGSLEEQEASRGLGKTSTPLLVIRPGQRGRCGPHGQPL